MSTAGLIHDLLAFVPAKCRTDALRSAIETREETGDHESVRALAAVLRKREAVPAASTTWIEEDGA